MIKKIGSLLLTLCVLFLILGILPIHGENEIYDRVLRLHVLANSDCEQDQAMKLKVRDAVLSVSEPLLREVSTREEAESVLSNNLSLLKATAESTLRAMGSEDAVTVELGHERYPTRTYDRLAFPSGNYLSLQVRIGSGEGKNWWCVMYPPLCFIDESTAIVSEDGKEVLRENLTDEEYEALFASKDSIEGQSLIYNWIKEIGEKYSLFR